MKQAFTLPGSELCRLCGQRVATLYASSERAFFNGAGICKDCLDKMEQGEHLPGIEYVPDMKPERKGQADGK